MATQRRGIRPQRIIYSNVQLRVLEKAFSKMPSEHPDYVALAGQLGITPTQTMVWFKNRKAKKRRMNQMLNDQEQRQRQNRNGHQDRRSPAPIRPNRGKTAAAPIRPNGGTTAGSAEAARTRPLTNFQQLIHNTDPGYYYSLGTPAGPRYSLGTPAGFPFLPTPPVTSNAFHSNAQAMMMMMMVPLTPSVPAFNQFSAFTGSNSADGIACPQYGPNNVNIQPPF